MITVPLSDYLKLGIADLCIRQAAIVKNARRRKHPFAEVESRIAHLCLDVLDGRLPVSEDIVESMDGLRDCVIRCSSALGPELSSFALCESELVEIEVEDEEEDEIVRLTDGLASITISMAASFLSLDMPCGRSYYLSREESIFHALLFCALSDAPVDKVQFHDLETAWRVSRDRLFESLAG